MKEEVLKRRGLLKKHAVVDHEVWQWKTKLEQTRGSRRVTKTEVQAYAVEAYRNVGINTFKVGGYQINLLAKTNPSKFLLLFQ